MSKPEPSLLEVLAAGRRPTLPSRPDAAGASAHARPVAPSALEGRPPAARAPRWDPHFEGPSW